ncbi:MAG TPA: 2-amino-4-hydroxy-6-hydroxymethyldihydropteridine diphosphokinase [Candidatus Binatia bacterium]
MPHRAFIGVGSNLGDRKANIAEALDRVGKLPGCRIVRMSSLYESEPHGDAKTWFVNAAFELETEFSAAELLKRLKAIEQAMGRKRVKGKKWGSRVIDLDILFFDNETVSTRTLKIPHPELPGRKFVLLPLAEVAPQHTHPELGQTVSQLLATTKDTKRVVLLPPK